MLDWGKNKKTENSAWKNEIKNLKNEGQKKRIQLFNWKAKTV